AARLVPVVLVLVAAPGGPPDLRITVGAGAADRALVFLVIFPRSPFCQRVEAGGGGAARAAGGGGRRGGGEGGGVLRAEGGRRGGGGGGGTPGGGTAEP